MLSNQITNNCVNEAGTNNGEGLSHGRCPVEEQRRPGRHQATARTGIRKKWSRVAEHSQDRKESLGALRRLVATGPSRKIHQQRCEMNSQ